MSQHNSSRSEGSYQALDHAANWVRFADTKATVLTAALGVVMTMLVSRAADIVSAARSSELALAVVASLATLAAGAFLFTLGWLVAAIMPQRKGVHAINRFSWPGLTLAAYEDLVAHAASVTAHEDAWRHTLVLSKVAERKFSACRAAAGGFACFVLLAIASVVAATLLNP